MAVAGDGVVLLRHQPHREAVEHRVARGTSHEVDHRLPAPAAPIGIAGVVLVPLDRPSHGRSVSVAASFENGPGRALERL